MELLVGAYTLLIDDEDAALVLSYKWRPKRMRARPKHLYFQAHGQGASRNRETVLLHRVIMAAPRGLTVDHRDGNVLDYRRQNLRLATRQQNNANKRAGWGRSRFKGVAWHKRHSTWIAQIGVNRRRLYLGSFATEEDAARAYDLAAVRHFGEFANLNFKEPWS